MKIAIVGYSVTEQEAPYLNTEWEIWSLNHKVGFIDRFDKWFDMHDLHNLQPCDFLYQFFQEIGSNLITCQENLDMFPKATSYPADEILNEFCDFIKSEKQAKEEKEEIQKGLVTNSIAWMIAYAIYKGATDIGLWGVDMSTSGEYRDQLMSCIYFLGIAQGRGIKIHLPEECKLIIQAAGKFYYNNKG